MHEYVGQECSVFGCEPRFRSPRCPPRRRTGRPPLTLGRLMPVRAGSPNVKGGAGSKPGSWLHLGSERRTPCRRAPRLKARRRTQRHPGCAPLASLGVNASRWRGRALRSTGYIISERNVTIMSHLLAQPARASKQSLVPRPQRSERFLFTPDPRIWGQAINNPSFSSIWALIWGRLRASMTPEQTPDSP